jgi:DNA-directed RNA polymerase subunit RPC12/RpoP
MLKPKYQCKQCKAEFEDAENSCSETAVKCPVCGSTDFKELRNANDVIEFLRNLRLSGGG